MITHEIKQNVIRDDGQQIPEIRRFFFANDDSFFVEIILAIDTRKDIIHEVSIIFDFDGEDFYAFERQLLDKK